MSQAIVNTLLMPTVDDNPNEELVKSLIEACKRMLRKNKIKDKKADTILFEYESIKQVIAFVGKIEPKTKKPNRVLRDLIDDLNQNVMPYVNSDVFDILGQFYTQFIRYAGSDSKTGLVLTPPHITDLFCEIAGLTEHDIVFDPCCGTGGFLVSAMKHMLRKSGNNTDKHESIKSKQLIGIEQRADMFTHACSNMMMRGDGKSNIHFGDCFDPEILKYVKQEQPTKAFLNPPYDVGPKGQLEFIESAMDCLVKDGICLAICQMSAAISSNKDAVAVRERLMSKHTLEAVLSMPDDLFHPVGVITCIIVMKAHTPHPENRKTFFGYFKDDGHLKIKHKGRIDQKGLWDSEKKKWLDCYINRESIAGLSVTYSVKADNEWCAEAYMETDYSTLTGNDFVKTIKDYVAFQFQQQRLLEVSSKSVTGEVVDFGSNHWKSFICSDLFEVVYGVNLELNKMQDITDDSVTSVPFVSRTAKENGVSAFVQRSKDLNINPPKTISVSAGGSVMECFFQPIEYYSGRDLYYLRPLQTQSTYCMFFLITLLKMEKYRFNYGRQVNKSLPNLGIKLPVDWKGKPDWQFMEDYIKSLPYSSNLSNA